MHGQVVSPRCQPRGNHGPEEGHGGLHAAENATGLGQFGAGLLGKVRLNRHLIERVEAALQSSANLLGPERLAGLQIDGLIVAAQASPRRLSPLLPGLAILNLDSDCLDVLRAHVPCALRTVRGPALRPSPGLDAGRPEEQIDPHRGGDYVCTAWEPRSRRVAVWDGPAGRREELAIPLPGRHHAVNVLLAAAVARHLGLDWDDIRAGLACFEGMPMRWAERRVGNVRMINDAYNANPLNMRASIGCFAEEDDAPGKWLVLGGMLELGAREAVEHDALGRFIAGCEWAGLITVGDLGGRIADGAVAAGMAAERIVRCSDAASAAAELRERASGGDAVLIKGSRRFRLEDVMTGFEQRGGERE